MGAGFCSLYRDSLAYTKSNLFSQFYNYFCFFIFRLFRTASRSWSLDFRKFICWFSNSKWNFKIFWRTGSTFSWISCSSQHSNGGKIWKCFKKIFHEKNWVRSCNENTMYSWISLTYFSRKFFRQINWFIVFAKY